MGICRNHALHLVVDRYRVELQMINAKFAVHEYLVIRRIDAVMNILSAIIIGFAIGVALR